MFSEQELARELLLKDDSVYGRLEFLLNTPELFTAVARMTGCRGIRSYAGHIFRLEPGRWHFVGWHTDFVGTRMLGLTINLSPVPYAGGILEIRECASKRMVARAPNPVTGDALLMRLSPSLEHRVSEVEGNAPWIALRRMVQTEPRLSCGAERGTQGAMRTRVTNRQSHTASAVGLNAQWTMLRFVPSLAFLSPE